MIVDKFDEIEIYQQAAEIRKIGNRAIAKVRKENKKMGIPIVFSKNGKIYYEMPDGEITTKSPFTSTEPEAQSA